MNRRDTAFRKGKTLNIDNPIKSSTRDGVFKLTETSLDKYKANLYTLLFTNVGERVMMPDFGTLMRYFLFEPLEDDVKNKIKNDIFTKVERYIPEILLQRIVFNEDIEEIENNRLSMKLYFTLKNDSTIEDYVELQIGT